MTPEQVKSLRESLRETQQGMADRIGVDIRTYQRWEEGARRPRGPALLLLRQLADQVADRAAEARARAKKKKAPKKPR